MFGSEVGGSGGEEEEEEEEEEGGAAVPLMKPSMESPKKQNTASSAPSSSSSSEANPGSMNSLRTWSISCFPPTTNGHSCPPATSLAAPLHSPLPVKQKGRGQAVFPTPPGPSYDDRAPPSLSPPLLLLLSGRESKFSLNQHNALGGEVLTSFYFSSSSPGFSIAPRRAGWPPTQGATAGCVHQEERAPPRRRQNQANCSSAAKAKG
ncbi:unnamed protein product [Pleuronectes platessa]|uniref:Uncharacterized protein n=1 Tax=Pleuronectes platessa TaxID=8262 RepID=A0A9N7UTJ6_PLEPL|nr:unnamed protein product [Pleuronectes platessa]